MQRLFVIMIQKERSAAQQAHYTMHGGHLLHSTSKAAGG